MGWGKHIRIDAGTGYSGDRTEPALELADKGRPVFLVSEFLAGCGFALATTKTDYNGYAVIPQYI